MRPGRGDASVACGALKPCRRSPRNVEQGRQAAVKGRADPARDAQHGLLVEACLVGVDDAAMAASDLASGAWTMSSTHDVSCTVAPCAGLHWPGAGHVVRPSGNRGKTTSSTNSRQRRGRHRPPAWPCRNTAARQHRLLPSPATWGPPAGTFAHPDSESARAAKARGRRSFQAASPFIASLHPLRADRPPALEGVLVEHAHRPESEARMQPDRRLVRQRDAHDAAMQPRAGEVGEQALVQGRAHAGAGRVGRHVDAGLDGARRTPDAPRYGWLLQ